MDEQLLPDLLQLRGSVVAACDEFFAEKENLTKPAAPVFVPDTFGAKGQVYDGWETRRRRGPGGRLPDRSARDWVIVRLGVPGVVHAVVVDTAFFTGNFPQACSVEACSVTGYPAFEEIAADSEAVAWQEIVPRGLLTGDARHVFKVAPAQVHARAAEDLPRRRRGPAARARRGGAGSGPARGAHLRPRRAGERRGRGGRQRPVRLLRAAQRHLARPVAGDGRGLGDPPAPQARARVAGRPAGRARRHRRSRRSTPPGTGATRRRARRCRRWTPPPAPRSPTRPRGASCCRRSACCRTRRTGSG